MREKSTRKKVSLMYYGLMIIIERFSANNVYSQPEEISNATKYNNNDSMMLDLPENQIMKGLLTEELPMIGQIILRYKKRRPLLPCVGAKQASASSTDKDSYIQDLNINSNAYQVTGFFRAVLLKVIPEEFWGCNDNLRVILNAIKKVRKLRR
ncbi:hypothetical protein F8M41_015917 [Gigaspora margarita]|uniref:Telomerase ribonucleoprotein complex - RNA-binding domain-containing protein n=1 Tax=Gigaspora margarita TaxID=4874 RepID=A0A8H4APY0_GIGMA|nr:hypothetical protein F8M41_015917 [Gigaspora margarita]